MRQRDGGKVAVSWLKIVRLGLGLGLGLAARILSHETATLPQRASARYRWTERTKNVPEHPNVKN